MTKKCSECDWLIKYKSENPTHYMYICNAEDGEELEHGAYHVVVIDITEFDSSDCLNYRPK